MKETVNIERKDKGGQALEDAETEMDTVAAARSPASHTVQRQLVILTTRRTTDSENRGATLQVPVMSILDPRKSMLCYGEQLPT